MEDRVQSLSRSLKVTLTVLKRPWAASSLALAMLITAGLAWAEGESTAPILVAVADFDYVDTSGEVRDQRVEHETRLRAFMRAIRDDLARSGQYRVVPLVCTQASCPTEGSAQLMKDARSSGATLLLYGGIHKESTLIQWMKVEALEVENGQHLFNRLMTFRGDTDESWTRAERFLIQQLTEEMNLKGTKQPQQ
jgi:hypothetical protein